MVASTQFWKAVSWVSGSRFNTKDLSMLGIMMIYGQNNCYITVTWYRLLFCTSNSIFSTFLWSTVYLTTPKF